MDPFDVKCQPEPGSGGTVINFTDCCRICMSQYANMNDIFQSTDYRLQKVDSISEKINYCTGLQISVGDKFPTLICDNCLNDLLIAYKFKSTSLRSQATFEDILNTTIKVSYSDDETNNDNVIEQNSDDDSDYKPDVEAENSDSETDNSNSEAENSNSEAKNYSSEGENSEVSNRANENSKSVKDDFRIIKLDLSDLDYKAIRQKKTKDINWVHDTLDTVIKRSERILDANKIIQEQIVKIVRPDYSHDLFEKISTTETVKSDPSLVDPQFSILQPACETCNIKFRNKKECAAHNKQYHPKKEQWICEICGSVLSRQTSFYVHRLSHGPYTFSCKLCDYKTWYKGVLEKHMRSHDGLKLHQCKICLNKFSTASGRNRHMRTAHGGEKRYACETCGKAFYDRRCLKLHIDSHDNIKRFTCEICQTQFTRRGHWRKHKLKQHGVVMPRMRPGRKTNKAYVRGKSDTDD